MAAAYLYHIVQNHPFIDGNKRTGAMAAFVFLKLHGFTLEADESVFETLIPTGRPGPNWERRHRRLLPRKYQAITRRHHLRVAPAFRELVWIGIGLLCLAMIGKNESEQE